MAVFDEAVKDQQENVPSAIGLYLFRTAVWKWYEEHQGDVVLRKWWFSITLRDCRPVIEAIFGAEPLA